MLIAYQKDTCYEMLCLEFWKIPVIQAEQTLQKTYISQINEDFNVDAVILNLVKLQTLTWIGNNSGIGSTKSFILLTSPYKNRKIY